jgi:LCP family protein required for cell wall assembly
MARRPQRGTDADGGTLIGHARLDVELGGTPGGGLANSVGLKRLGELIDEPDGAGSGETLPAVAAGTPAEDGGDVPGESPPNASGVAAPPVVRPATRSGRGHRSRGRRVMRWTVVAVALVLLAAGSVYGYLWYRLGQIRSLKCSACAVAAPGAPYNVLLVGSDSRAGATGAAAQAFGSASQVPGQRSDTIKIIHVDPASGAAQLLSIPRDTYVALSGMPSGTGLATDNKINTAFNSGPVPLIKTIENTFGIPINHFVTTSFSGVIDLVTAVGGINLNFPYPVRDNDNGNNNSGLAITHAGCQTLDGNMALALARSRYYQYEVRPYVWYYDGSSDLGRIQRQNAVIAAVINKAKSSYNPLSVNAFLGSIVHDITKDEAMSTSMLLSLAQRFHAFSGSSLKTFTLPTVGASSYAAGSVEVVQESAALQVISQFLGTSPGPVVTPPLNSYGSPITVPPSTTTVPTGGSQAGVPTTAPPAPGTGPFNPTPC